MQEQTAPRAIESSPANDRFERTRTRRGFFGWGRSRARDRGKMRSHTGELRKVGSANWPQRERVSKVQTPWVSQFDANQVPRAGDKACYRACRVMMKGAGVSISDSTTNRIQVATSENASGRVTTTSARTKKARDYIDGQLKAGRPVTAGLSYFDANYNRDKITDHFVVINGKGTDSKGRTFYTYSDPLGADKSSGTNRRFMVDPKNGNLVRPGRSGQSGAWSGHAELSMVILNRG